MLGETIKGFEITGRLGQGAMGEVWVAEQPIVNTKVAIKFLLAKWSSDQVIVQRFFDEARAVSRIKHAGIAKIYDVGFHNGSAFLIMELLEGETLASRLGRLGRFPIGHVGEVGKQITSVLEATHAAKIIHRDLKPENIFLVIDDEPAGGERAKILDFGIAKLSSAVGHTGGGNTMGTPGYMGPELWTDAAKADPRTDVYAVGCIAFEMCCGRRPFEVASFEEAYHKHMFERPPRARTFAPEVPRELDEVIARALAKESSKRPSMRELRKVFSDVAAAHPVALATTQPGMPSLSKARPRPRLPRLPRFVAIGAGILVALAIFVVVAYAATQCGSEKPVVVAASRAATVNEWVRVTIPATPVVLGIRSDDAPDSVRGFRPARKILSPGAPYELQEHEVTWSEIEPWLAKSHTLLASPPWAADPSVRRSLPVTGVTWSIALAYCESLGGSLPTEEQWEYAARGPERRPNSWGTARLDRDLTRVYGGATAIPVAVKTSVLDRTPAPALYDLIGNVQEWTLGLWRDDMPDTDESWVTTGKETSIRAIRGLPLGTEPPRAIPEESAAYREELCATGKCVEKTSEKLRYVGFRCARPVP